MRLKSRHLQIWRSQTRWGSTLWTSPQRTLRSVTRERRSQSNWSECSRTISFDLYCEFVSLKANVSCALLVLFSNSLVNFEANVNTALEKVLIHSNDYLIRTKAQEVLSEMENYAKERFFHRVFFSEHCFASTFTEEQRWIVLEMFLEDHAFDYIDVEGYVFHHL